MKNFLKIFLIMASALVILIPVQVSALQPPRVAQVYGIEGYKFLLELAAAEDEETFNQLRSHMINRDILEDGGGLLHFSINPGDGSRNTYLQRFISAFETLRFPILKGEELGWVDISEFTSEHLLSVNIHIDSPVGFLERISPYSFSARHYRFHSHLREEYVDGVEIIERVTSLSDRRIEFDIFQGYHRINASIHPRYDPYMPDISDTCMLELFDFKTLEELLDAPSTWAAAQVNTAISKDIVPLRLQFRYSQPITRGEFSALAVLLYETSTGSEITERSFFADTEDINVQKLAGLGVVSGVGHGNFAPSDSLTREQAAVILTRLADAIGQPLPQASSTFADSLQISSWATQAVGQIQGAGIMEGTGNNMFSPQGAYTREQSIITILRLFERLR